MRKSVKIFLAFVSMSVLSFSVLKAQRSLFSRTAMMNLAASTEWTDVVNISTSPQDSYLARVVGNSYGRAFAIWVEEGGGKYVAFNTNESGSWGSSESVTKGQVGVREGPWPEINIDKNQNVVVSYTGVTDGNYDIVYNRRVGTNWQGHENVSRTYTGGSVSSTILVDLRNNDYFVVWQDDIDRPSEEAAYWQGYVRYKNEGEGDWIGAGAIMDPSARAYAHQAAMDANGTAYAVWANRVMGNISRVFFSQNVSPKDSTKWTVPIDLSNLTGMEWAEPQVACDSDGNVYVVWMDAREGNIEIYFKKRINGEWGPLENLSQTPTTSELPTVAVNKRTGDIYVAWQENEGGNWEIYFKEYKEGAWQPVENLSQTPSTSSQPHLSVDEMGGIHLVFTDRLTGSWNIFYRNRPGIQPVFPPIRVKLATLLDGDSSSGYTKTNILTWEENQKNKDHENLSYTIYRKEDGELDSQFILIATVPEDTFSYEDMGLPTTKKFWYKMKTLSEFGLESEGSTAPVTEIWMWPPVNLSLQSQMNRYLFYTEKINTLDWEHNPLNDAITLERYDIYRKKTSEDDSAYTLLSSVDAETFEYEDRYLSTTDKYSYRIKAVDFYGVESDVSESVSEN